MGRKTENFFRWAAGASRVPRSESEDSDAVSVPAAGTKHKRRALKLGRRAGKKGDGRAKRSEYRQTYPDPRKKVLKERYDWSEDFENMGHKYRHHKEMPALNFYAIGNTPNTEARLIRPATMPRMNFPRAPRDYWRDGVIVTIVPKSEKAKSDNDSGYGSLSDEDDDGERIIFYNPAKDQISPPLRHGRIVVEPNPHFEVAWKKVRTTKSGIHYHCRMINGYMDGVVRKWAQGVANEGGRIYMERYDDYRTHIKESTLKQKQLEQL